VLWIPSQIIKKHLDQAVLPYCQNNDQSSTEQLIKALDLFYRSLVPEMAIPSQAADSTTEDCDVMFITLPPGIDNLGATCYLNSQLQCLSLNPVFREGVISWRKPIGRSNRSALADTNNMNAIITRLQKLLVMMHHGSHSVISAEKLAVTIGINNDEMQDPTEFTGFLFDRMHEIFQESDLLKDLLPGIFQGSLEYVTECQKCHTRSVRLEPFMQLTLPIKGSKTKGSTSTTDVKSCLDSYLSTKEFLTGDNQYYCLLCKTKCDATREINLQKVPPVLNLQLSRYKFDLKTNTKRKTNDHVRLPNVIMIPSKNIVEGSCTNRTSERRNSNNNNDSIFVQEEYMLCAVVSSW
jgi:ubiquitin C-terminal hydrolase